MSSDSPKVGSLRPSQIITTFGPGAIYDVLSDSILVMGIDFWDDTNYTETLDERLVANLKKIHRFRNIQNFHIPSSSGNKENIRVTTFPTWGECPRCHKLTRRNGNPLQRKLKCPDCKTVATHPARLIIACKNGHLDDFPWKRWVNHVNQDCDDTKLYLRQSTKTVSLAGLEIQCDNCGARENLGMALSAIGIKSKLGFCHGKRPWLKDTEECRENPRGLLKGASNVYFSKTVNALYIPPFTDEINKILKEHWKTISLCRDEPDMIRSIIKRANPNFDIEEVFRRIQERFDHTEGKIQVDIENDEWNVFKNKYYNHEDFKTEKIEVPYKFKDIIDNLLLVRRLKETTVLIGFTRIDPPDPEDPVTHVSQISSDEPTWLPAVENYGEGIFFSFNEELLQEWEKIDGVGKRNEIILDQYRNMYQHQNLFTVPPRFIMLHTLSHLLIREFSTYAGYSAASIRERIYGKRNMAGILLYTSSASSDGSLGGLVNLGKTAFGLILGKSITNSKWCSSDPLCALHNPEMTHRNSGASCHACSFLPETSCINMNSLLDRKMVNDTSASSTNKDPYQVRGFFNHALSR